jgi:hypothetical protein
MVQVIEYRFPTFEKRLVITGQKKQNEVAGTKGTFWGEAKFRIFNIITNDKWAFIENSY